MSKVNIPFQFTVPVATSSRYPPVKNLGEIEISGFHDGDPHDPQFDYNYIKWHGKDILPLLEHCPLFDSAKEAIDELVSEHITSLVRDYEDIPDENE